MKLFVDDIRDALDEHWTLVRTISEAIRCIARFGAEITEISLDHDISHEVRVNGEYRPFPSPETFAAVAYFIGAYYDRSFYRQNPQKIPKITAHTANPVGAETIAAILSQYEIGCKIEMRSAAHRKK
jgi:hypothetical protein